MAVTKLMNIKSCPHGAGRHLYNSIRYIINPEKTRDGLLVGGNAGSDVNEIYNVMMDTKRDWDKTDGRQGYHFVLSWKPGEVNAEEAFQLIKEFCEEYLGDKYDYVFSVHDDQEHMHGHIVFNSVNRNTGYKYRYEKGDWEKYIQPITDKICEQHGLSRLEYEKENRKGKSYAEHFAEKEGRYTWKKVIQADIDYMISCSESWEDFLEQMRQIGYSFPRSGVRKKIGEYITFCEPGGHRRRSDSLGPGYSVADIKRRIAGDTIPERQSGFVSPQIEKSRMGTFRRQTNYLSSYQMKGVKKFLQTSTYFSRKNPFAVTNRQIRKDLLQVERLGEDCRYLLRNNIRSRSELDQKDNQLRKQERYCKERISQIEILRENPIYKRYFELLNELKKIRDPADDRFEEIQDQIEKLEENLPPGIAELMEESEAGKDQLAAIRQEKRIVRHIKKIDEGIKNEMLLRQDIGTTHKMKSSVDTLKRGDAVWRR